MLFAEHIVLVDDISEMVNSKLKAGREVLESKGFKRNRSKTERNVDLVARKKKIMEHIILRGRSIHKSDFCYLGSIFHKGI